MPEVDGFTVATHMQLDPALGGTTILMLSSADLAGDATRCREIGIARHLMKPITKAELWEAIVTVLGTAAHTHAAPPTPSLPAVQGTQRHLPILLHEHNRLNQQAARSVLDQH